MKKLTPIELEDGTTIYMEVEEDIEIVSETEPEKPKNQELTRGDLGKEDKGLRDQTRAAQEKIRQSFEAIESTISTYTNHTLNAFRKVGSGNIDKVTLEFGVKVGGKAGIPYVTEGSADSHLKIVVECSFPDEQPENNS